MRALIKSPTPGILERKGRQWTDRYIDSGGTTNPWNHVELKTALLRETDEKCAYCEGKLLAVSFGDIEHILPKSLFPKLVVAWDNLTLACSRCNQFKDSKYDAIVRFVNPYSDRIEDHLLFLGAYVYAVSNDGEYTVNELRLNEANRVESRNRTLQSVEQLVRRYEAAPEGYSKEQLSQLIEYQSSKGEYTAAVRSYLATRKQKVAASLNRSASAGASEPSVDSADATVI